MLACEDVHVREELSTVIYQQCSRAVTNPNNLLQNSFPHYCSPHLQSANSKALYEINGRSLLWLLFSPGSCKFFFGYSAVLGIPFYTYDGRASHEVVNQLIRFFPTRYFIYTDFEWYWTRGTARETGEMSSDRISKSIIDAKESAFILNITLCIQWSI